MRYGSVCSGIEAATQAWHPMGWKPSFFSEIDAFPCAVLQHHYPDVPLHGDFTTIQDSDYDPIDLLAGGTPCQSFSVAGLRKGLDDPRGNLMLGFGALAKRLGPTWLAWENVPGVLSAGGGRDFGTFLGMLAELGYGFAYRVLDAQYFGVAQRRRRVFVVGYLGDWRPAAAVLFERQSLSGDSAPSREAREEVAGSITASSGKRGGMPDCGSTPGQLHPVAFGGGNVSGLIDPAACLTARGQRIDFEVETFMVQSIHGTQDPIVSDRAHALGRNNGAENAICFDATQITSATNRSNPQPGDPCHPLAAGAHAPAVAGMAVRRLTPRECERLQGFPDDFTKIPYRNKPTDKCPDGPRYKALGNSMAVPVMAWIGERIQKVERILSAKEAAA